MSVNPGFGGQKFIPTSPGKLREAAAMINQVNPEIFLEVDGGIDDQTVGEVVSAGANVLVAGNYIFGKGRIAEAITTLRENAIR
ncbi:MAG: ribulose-phosphate 3-epimerase, partial [bacterium]